MGRVGAPCQRLEAEANWETVEEDESPLLIPSHADLSPVPQLGCCTLGIFMFMAPEADGTSRGATRCCASLKKRGVSASALAFSSGIAVFSSLSIGILGRTV